MTHIVGTGFIRAHGRQLVDGDGKPLLLRGVGLGNWMLPEGYMWKFSGPGGDRPRRIAQRFRELIGPEKAEQFWETFYERYITEADVDKIAAEGYNSIRLPINASFLLQEGIDSDYIAARLELTDRFIEWCRARRLYVVLDLHGAPGGQTGANIDDSEYDHPDLFTDPAQRKRAIDLWVMLASRYKDDPIIAGYDLLNEPLPDHFSQYWDRLVPFYQDTIAAIREVDSNHMMIIEGAHWATNFSMITERLDDNMLLQFHKYWNEPDLESIQKYIDKAVELNVPLYMGEGGENNPEWYTGAFQLFEDHDISWNFWPWKKLDTLNSPCSIRPPQDWERIQAYVAGTGEHPGQEAAEAILNEYLDHIRLEQCDYRHNVVNSMLRRAPLRIAAPYYGYRGAGVDHSVRPGQAGDIPLRPADGVRFGFAHPSADNEVDFANHGGAARRAHTVMCVHLEAGDWLRYEFNVAEERAYTLRICASAAGSAASFQAAIPGRGAESGVASGVRAESSAADADERRAEGGTADADGQWAEGGTADADGQWAEGGAADADGRRAESGTADADGRRAEGGTADAGGQWAEVGAADADGRRAEGGTIDATDGEWAEVVAGAPLALAPGKHYVFVKSLSDGLRLQWVELR